MPHFHCFHQNSLQNILSFVCHVTIQYAERMSSLSIHYIGSLFMCVVFWTCSLHVPGFYNSNMIARGATFCQSYVILDNNYRGVGFCDMLNQLCPSPSDTSSIPAVARTFVKSLLFSVICGYSSHHPSLANILHCFCAH